MDDDDDFEACFSAALEGLAPLFPDELMRIAVHLGESGSCVESVAELAAIQFGETSVDFYRGVAAAALVVAYRHI